MLKNIPAILSPELLKVLCEMGHGDEIVLGDGNFPAESMGKNAIVIRADGHGVNELLDAILTVLPLDPYVECPAALMEVSPGDSCGTPTVWADYRETLRRHGEKGEKIEMMERFAFYERSKKAYAIIATGETAIYANLLLKKGVVK
ncbi:MAG: L-fucose mutarotase [Eubacteriales bacterium]|nr:L-fucose mutarotase [Eubacteriales bacterium]